MFRTICIGDIHGCLVEFKELIDKLAIMMGDRVICLGDFMDKGPLGPECVQFARESGFRSVLANHEERHLRWHKREWDRVERGLPNAMTPFNDQDLEAHHRLKREDLAWLASLPPYIEIMPGWVAVHGGFMHGLSIQQQDMKKVLRMRWVTKDGKTLGVDYSRPETLGMAPEGGLHWTELWTGPENVVYGHEAYSLSKPRMSHDNGIECCGIDTGVVHGGRLTALVFPNREVVQVTARSVYCIPPTTIPD